MNLAARSPDAGTQERAFRLTVSALLCLTTVRNEDLDIAAHTFYRLGFFKAVDVLKKMHPDWVHDPPLAIRMDVAGKRIENAADKELDTVFTDFQRDLFRAILSLPEGSVSAPTSAGKSFVLARAIRGLLQKGPATIVYLVPTRALIREVAARIRSDLLEQQMSVPVRTTPIPVRRDRASQGIVYVLTQERLLSLLHHEGPEAPVIDLLLVDEAQEIEEDDRGVLLEGAIRKTRKEFPGVRVFYASPTIANPHYLLLPTSAPDRAHVERRSPVAHYYWKARYGRERRGKRSTHWLEVSDLEDRVKVKIDLPRAPGGSKYLRRAHAALRLHHPGTTTVVYCDTPDQAEKTAEAIARERPPLSNLAEPVKALIHHIQREVHPNHPLIEWLRAGVAVHFRPLPSLVRSQIEHLCEQGHIDFVCCTSTLLKGVNLPCRNVILIDPWLGKHAPLKGMQLRNLSGRAGRLDRDLRGNIWLINPDDWTELPEGRSYEQMEPRPIVRALEKGFADVDNLLSNFEANRLTDKFAQAMLGTAVELRENQLTLADFAQDPAEQTKLRALEARIDGVRAGLAVPREIVVRNSGLDPRRIDDLYKHVRDLRDQQPTAFADLFPNQAAVQEENLYDYLHRTIPILRQFLDSRPLSDKALNFRAAVMRRWLLMHPWKLLIRRRCDDVAQEAQSQGKPATPDDRAVVLKSTRDVVRFIEDEVRFDAARQYRILEDVLTATAKGTRFESLAAEILPLHLYLEFGTTKSEKMQLLGLGFTRATVDLVADAFRDRGWGIEDPEQVVERLRAMSREEMQALRLPPESWVEIASLVGRDLREVIWTE